jgi:DNA-directed RNA polymerase, mitochondrial
MEKLRELQVALESEWSDLGYQRYVRSYQQAPFSNTQVGSHMLSKGCHQGLTDAIKEYRDSLGGPRSFYQRAIFFCLTPEEVAIVGLKYMLDFVFKNLIQRRHGETKSCFSTLCINLADHLVSMFNWKATCKEAPEHTEYMHKFLKTRSRIYRIRLTKELEQKVLKGNILKLSTQEKIPLGYALAKLIIESTGFFETYQAFSKAGHSITSVAPVPELLEDIFKNIDRCGWLRPVYMPMVCQPEPWTSPDDGGYITLPVRLVSHSKFNSKKLWEAGEIQMRAEVINHIQSVPFRIDSGILDIATEAYRNGHRSVPVSDAGIQFPQRPWQTRAEKLHLLQFRPDVVKEFNAAMSDIYAKFYASVTIGKRIAFLRTLSVARSFLAYDNIWFPWCMDYRGRYYPIPSGLSPQGDDLGKALLQFAKATPMTTEDWPVYKIHGAGLMGVDKVPFSERIEFINKHEQEILKAGTDYLSTSWWELADKPWRMLQWCREYTALRRGRQATTSIPCDLDGSCNGLQHLSMTIRDEQTGRLVNLTPSPEPMDIYTDVQQKVEELLPEDNYWKGKVTRKLVKRNVMTTPYSVTKIGMGDQIRDQMQKDKGMLTKTERLKASELRDYNYEAIQQLLGRSAQLMQWYQDVARCYMKQGLVMQWVLPDGFRVIQDILRYKRKEVQLEGRTINISYRVDTNDQDTRRNVNAVSPNVTHSMDATHMTLWIRRLMQLDPGVPFICVHDSFGLPAPKLRLIGGEILSTFVGLYESFDITKAICDDFRQQTNGKHELPPPPDRGSLQLSEVRKSIYAFA